MNSIKEDIINKTIDSIIDFITVNGWKKLEEGITDYDSYYKENNYIIDISKEDKEIVFIADIGDVYHLQIKGRDSFYVVVGYMVYYRLLSVDFKKRYK